MCQCYQARNAGKGIPGGKGSILQGSDWSGGCRVELGDLDILRRCSLYRRKSAVPIFGAVSESPRDLVKFLGSVNLHFSQAGAATSPHSSHTGGPWITLEEIQTGLRKLWPKHCAGVG